MAEHTYAQLIRRYFEGCNEADYDKLVSCFTPDAVHYFPAGLPDIPWRTADTIARKWIWCVDNLGSQWTIEKILVSHDSHEAVIEWTHWKSNLGTALRGDEWYVFDEQSGLIKEIRAYYASTADKDVPINEWVDFDYAGRGYNLGPNTR
ncbi:nuclear transport factor 2 family protein [Pseudomonas sp. SWI44]|uniref:nuclear transport factor 2 family protein n=1 Tax=Pseudomonas sp. SWI44 TaxID=2083053 RepID=UPI000CE5EF89|nr:nuclear transport factor 2 family protein [Pseudomonas sp. SWI44]AVD90123.1 ketosteroid isomerase [Pseudomonas sp. SWI44]